MVPRSRTYLARAGRLGVALAAAAAGSLLAPMPLTAQQGATPPTRADSLRADSLRRDSLSRRGMPGADTARRAMVQNAVTPPADQGRGVDAEIRVALFELMHDRDVQALARLRALEGAPMAGAAGMAAGATSGAAAGLRGRDDLRFLLAQGYYRLGMDSAFRATAQPLATSGRYAPVLRGQLMLDAYRRGDNARARQLAQQMDGSEQRGLAQLVAGLADYQAGEHAAARASFQQAQQAGAPYAAYAQYMEALTLLRADTTQTQPALQAMERVAAAPGTDPVFADQVRLTAAQLAYEAERWDDAIRLAGQVREGSGLGAQALLTRAWALYKSEDVSAAAEAFRTFAMRYPQLPERDEARLMAAQALLQTGRTDEAGRLFAEVADSMSAELATLSGRAGGAMTDAARALVQARTAGLLFVNDPASGKAVALHDAAGAEGGVLALTVRDTMALPATPRAPEHVSLETVSRRLAGNVGAMGGTGADSAGAAGATTTRGMAGGAAMVPRRVLFAPVSATSARGEFATRSAALYSADVGLALARWELGEALEARARQLAMLRALDQMVGEEARAFDALEAQLAAARDSLARVGAALDAARTSIGQMLQAQVQMTRMLANENLAIMDSVRRGLTGGLAPQDEQLLESERRTAQLYAETAALVEQGLNGAIDRHPAFALRDSVRARGDRMGQMLADARREVDATREAIRAELARLEGSESDRVRTLRQTLANAEARRGSAEQAVVAVVERELAARTGELLATLRRDTEAAEFGQASTSFFQALDADRRAEGASRTGSSAPPVAVSPSGTPQPQNK